VETWDIRSTRRVLESLQGHCGGSTVAHVLTKGNRPRSLFCARAVINKHIGSCVAMWSAGRVFRMSSMRTWQKWVSSSIGCSAGHADPRWGRAFLRSCCCVLLGEGWKLPARLCETGAGRVCQAGPRLLYGQRDSCCVRWWRPSLCEGTPLSDPLCTVGDIPCWFPSRAFLANSVVSVEIPVSDNWLLLLAAHSAPFFNSADFVAQVVHHDWSGLLESWIDYLN